MLVLSEPVTLPEYGQLPTLGLLDQLYTENKQQPYTVAGVSFGTSTTCSGTSGAYRIDQAADLAFLASFEIVP